MGGVIAVDERLFKLADQGPLQAAEAAILGRMQLMMSQQLGHVVALNDEYVWARLAYPSKQAKTRVINVRCIRCGCVANLNDWIRGSQLSSQRRAELMAKRRTAEGIRRWAFIAPCDGDKKGVRLVQTLTSMCEGSPKPVQPIAIGDK